MDWEGFLSEGYYNDTTHIVLLLLLIKGCTVRTLSLQWGTLRV